MVNVHNHNYIHYITIPAILNWVKLICHICHSCITLPKISYKEHTKSNPIFMELCYKERRFNWIKNLQIFLLSVAYFFSLYSEPSL